jgi:phage virion morphogenesis protein
MSLGVRATVTDNGVLNALAALALNSGDKAALLDELGINLEENNRLRFVDQEDPDGNPWAPSQRAIKQNGQTLRDTGALMSSLTHRVGADYVEVGTDTRYAPYLHDGTENMVARPIVGFSTDDNAMVLEVVTDFLLRSMKGSA